jgi:hypothetical protein
MNKKFFLFRTLISFSFIITAPLNATQWGKSFVSQVEKKVDEATTTTQEMTKQLRASHQNAPDAIAQLTRNFPDNPTASSTYSLNNYPKTAQTVAQKLENDLNYAIMNFITSIDARNFTNVVKNELITFINKTYSEDFRKVFASIPTDLGLAKKAFEQIAIDALKLIQDKSGTTRQPRSKVQTPPLETIKHLHDRISQEKKPDEKKLQHPTKTRPKKPNKAEAAKKKLEEEAAKQKKQKAKKLLQEAKDKAAEINELLKKTKEAQEKEKADKKLEKENKIKKEEAAQKLNNRTKSNTKKRKPTRRKKAITLEDKINDQFNKFAEKKFPTNGLDQLTLMNETYELFGNFDRDDTKAQGARFEKALQNILDKITNISALKSAQELITRAHKEKVSKEGPADKKQQPFQEPAKQVLTDIQTRIANLKLQAAQTKNFMKNQTTAERIFELIKSHCKALTPLSLTEDELTQFMVKFTQMICPQLPDSDKSVTCLCHNKKHDNQTETEELRKIYTTDDEKIKLLTGALKYAWGQDYLNIKQTLNQLPNGS